MTEITLTPDQIQNWRKVLVSILGPYALFMPDKHIQAFRDKFQDKLQKEQADALE